MAGVTGQLPDSGDMMLLLSSYDHAEPGLPGVLGLGTTNVKDLARGSGVSECLLLGLGDNKSGSMMRWPFLLAFAFAFLMTWELSSRNMRSTIFL
jgi:hypothetical protein